MLALKKWGLKKIFGESSLTPALQTYLSNSYPNNHNYSIYDQKLVPHTQLAKRSKVIQSLYPKLLTSLLDLSVCKGYFAFAGAQQLPQPRVLGVDVNKSYVDACNTINDSYLRLPNVKFSNLSLSELANNHLVDVGGAFQTVLLINTYQYLYFGSDSVPHCYYDHKQIFSEIRKVCTERLIFNNRTELSDCQNYNEITRAKDKAKHYCTEEILAAANEYFIINKKGTLGRYPLWVLEAR